MSAAEATLVHKTGGALTKRIWIAPDGTVKSDGSHCVMVAGNADRWRINGLPDVAAAIGDFGTTDALTLGALAPGVPDHATITTRGRLNGAAQPNLITRTTDYFKFSAGPTLCLLDFDKKAMPAAVAAKIDAIGGFWPALVSVAPDMATAARVVRASTSAGLYDGKTGARFPSSGGSHTFLIVEDGRDIERFLKTLHQRAILAGLGWFMLGAAGQFLERSIIDRTVGSPERLVFEGAPVLVAPLMQDAGERRPIIFDGDTIDTTKVCPPLSAAEETQLRTMLAQEHMRLKPDAERVRAAYVDAQARRMTGVDHEEARRIIERRCAGVLLPDTVLDFDDTEIGAITVGTILSSPERYIDETLSDPVEGIDYGRCKAKVLRAGRSVVVHSLAHGISTTYRLLHDRKSAEAAIRKASRDDADKVFVCCVLTDDLDAGDIERLLGVATEASGVGRRALSAMLKEARAKAKAEAAAERRKAAQAARTDPRPQVPVPPSNAEWLPQMAILNSILGKVDEPEPPMRDIDGNVARVRVRRAPKLPPSQTLAPTRKSRRRAGCHHPNYRF
jgi:hypothetical protein